MSTLIATRQPHLWTARAAILCAAMAATPALALADGDVINACVNPSSGVIRIVDAPSSCLPHETPLSWNVQGPQGSGLAGYEIVTHQDFLAAGSFANIHVECTSGKKVLGGGFDIETPNDVKVFSSEPSDGQGNVIDHGWNVYVQNAGSVTRQVMVSAVCALGQ